jgi:hypothetical protein
MNGKDTLAEETKTYNELVSGQTMIADPPPPNTEAVYARLNMLSGKKVRDLAQIAVATAAVAATGGGKC